MLYWIIIAICVAEFIFSSILHFLNKKASHLPIPSVLSGLYDEETYRRQQLYRRLCELITVEAFPCSLSPR